MQCLIITTGQCNVTTFWVMEQHPRHAMHQDLTTAIEHWNQLKPLMNQCPPAVQQTFRRLRGELEPLMVKMQIVYSQ